MARRVSFSDERLAPNQIAEHHAILESAIHQYYSEPGSEFVARFTSYTSEEVLEERNGRLYEAGAASAMTVLASVEASFRVDFLLRCYGRMKDDLSRAFLALYRAKELKVSLSEDLLDAWKAHSDVSTRLVGDIRTAFGYRHWLAHGRYWVPKLGRQYDFASIYDLACTVEEAFPFLRP